MVTTPDRLHEEDLDQLRSPYSAGKKPEWAGTSWSPHFALEEDTGEVRSVPRVISDTVPDDAEMLTEVGLDPAVWCVSSRRESRWQKYDGDWLQAFRLTVQRRGASGSDLSAEDMNTILKSYRSPGKPKVTSGTLVVGVADSQIGKVEAGGTAALVERFAWVTEDIRQSIKSRRTKLDKLILLWGGDCIEGIVSQDGKLATRLDLSVTEQLRLYRRLALHQIAELAPLAREVVVATVPGNHDETTRQFSTAPTDSWALEGMSAVSDALAMNKRYDHVTFVFPAEEEASVVFNAGTDDEPFIIGMTHGHLARSANSVIDWWRGQAHGDQPVGRCNLLVTGHWHTLRVQQTGTSKTWIQLPSFDGSSSWFRRKTGEDSQAGMVTFEITGEGSGWDNLRLWE